MTALADRNCYHRPKGETPPTAKELSSWMGELDNWVQISEGGRPGLRKAFKFPDFSSGIEFASQIAEISNEQDHHPKISIEWGKVELFWWTHTMNGLSENDFIMAAKVDKIYPALSK